MIVPVASAPSSAGRKMTGDALTADDEASRVASRGASSTSSASDGRRSTDSLDSIPPSPADDVANLAQSVPRRFSECNHEAVARVHVGLHVIPCGHAVPGPRPEVLMVNSVPSMQTPPRDADVGREEKEAIAEPSPRERWSEEGHVATNGGDEAGGVADERHGDAPDGGLPLVETERSRLKLHIETSMKNIPDDSDIALAHVFRSMPTAAVVTVGLDTMVDIMEGRSEPCPMKMLSFVHVVYAMSSIIYEQDDAPRYNRQDYMRVVGMLWKPVDVKDDDFTQLTDSYLSQPDFEGGKGQGWSSDGLHRNRFDSLVFVAQYFLDDLEDSALDDENRTEVQAAALCLEHLRDASLDALDEGDYKTAACDTLTVLGRRYGGVAGWQGAVGEILDDVLKHFVTPRRLELDLMRVGKMRLSPGVYWDEYIPFVRSQVDSLFVSFHFDVVDSNPRLRYYRHSLFLMKFILQYPEPDETLILGYFQDDDSDCTVNLFVDDEDAE
ncbi:hypothetical protein DCS_00663 [Drechmeria coniospora]|uniref:Uncharacterized protein n=1 Tax=Drechmeria coniospora TaxID=98403 RepID=A0A151GR15_DRECN|nr:hypothetical protein DCS_00663 [Drechmeria coniospora]KYK59533.1 hypothetical protein DCS_00663 [Drechmeria coniospora]